MPDDIIREIGLRFVETCSTCRHKADTNYGALCKYRDIDVFAQTVCNDYSLSRRDLNWHTAARDLPIVGTSNLYWIVCTSCGWEGWHTGLLQRPAEDPNAKYPFVEFCPKCKTEIPA